MYHPVPLHHRAFALAGCALLAIAAAAPSDGAGATKPSLILTAMPPVGFAPARVRFFAELKGDDSADLYCAAVEWDFGDETKSEQKVDCEPYEPGKSEIKRRFTIEKVFDLEGEWRVYLRLKQKNKVVVAGTTVVKVRQGIGGSGDET